ncbi:NmrA-like protein [Scardovia inopinata]|uniref:NAD(P)-binding domain-containing protein n=1 Tax=Scardovia inopinata F0304 TaxID=641146 RepID=W5II28_SCAIO|nr:SDR family oxidoreductase [Scardovia inopinata]EFG26515.1 hypothetical protein HMPREF9020_00134 [Scardovia inopinata F0304]BAR06110.1 conserved hypothetical protein [Scardovia inopinata JCM 12537]SUV51630.1 NmrA-like protein [Scardovia inopinata]
MTDTARPALALTGVSGHIGSMVARLLADSGYVFRMLARKASLDRLPQYEGCPRCPFVYGDDPSTRAALQGVDTVLMVSARESLDRVKEHQGFVDAALAAGVRQIVYISFDAASDDADFTLGRDHYATEEYIKKSGLDYTFLRDNFYLEALISWAQPGTIAGPAGDGKVSAVSQKDVAAVAAAVLRNPRLHSGRTYTLTGPEAFTLQEFADRLTKAGRKTTYKNETLEEAYASRREAYQVPQWELDAWVSSYTAIASGRLSGVTHDIELVTGHAPLSIEDVLRSQEE